MRLLFCGDVVGRAGRAVVMEMLPRLRRDLALDFVVVNGENAAGGFGITEQICQQLHGAGADVITTGNHVWDNSEVLKILDVEQALLRPANYPEGVRGHGHCVIERKGLRICVINLQGRLFMEPIDCPFRKFDALYVELKEKADIIIVDFHAEATSEKQALGWYLDGRASAVFGTHTHVQTSDERILPGGTGYITDIGMTGSFQSVIGINKDNSLRRFLTFTRVKFEVADRDNGINGVVFDFNRQGRTERISRILVR
jgi:metallophosphoesterase (TIGR00282 family)